MTALINGLPFQSFCNVPFKNADSSNANTNSERGVEHGISNLFLRYESLRWILLDEFHTLGCETLATGEVRQDIREENTWAKRSSTEARPWGGLNLGCMDDFWQFCPVNLTAIFDNPLKSYVSSRETILSMFWTREANSVSEFFFELTEENGCQDKWLSGVIYPRRRLFSQCSNAFFSSSRSSLTALGAPPRPAFFSRGRGPPPPPVFLGSLPGWI